MDNTTIAFRSENNNSYLYNYEKKILLSIHPLLEHFYLSDYPDKQQTKFPLQENSYTPEEIAYYKKKYVFLKRNIFMNKTHSFKNLDGKVNPKIVQENLSNVRQIIFEVTESCNLNCYYCGYGHLYSGYKTRSNKKINFNNAKTLLDYFFNLFNSPENSTFNNNIAISFYGGEPLLNISFIKKTVEYINKQQIKGKNIIFNIATNGLLLDKYTNFLVENNFFINISLDGNLKNNSFRVYHDNKSSFNKVFQNAKKLKNNYPLYFETNVGFSTVLHKNNSLKEIHNFFKNEFDKIPIILPLNPMGIRNDKKDTFYKTYLNLLDETKNIEDYPAILENLYISNPSMNLTNKFIDDFLTPPLLNYNALYLNDSEKNVIPTGTCTPFAHKVYLTANNKLLMCERTDSKYTFGEIKDGNLLLNPQKVSEQYNFYLDKIRKICSKCFRSKNCRQCMFYISDLEESPKCDGYLGKNKLEKLFFTNISSLEKKSSFIPLEGSHLRIQIEPYVYINIKQERALLYNTFSGECLEYSSPLILEIIQELHKKESNRSYILAENLVYKKEIQTFITDIRKLFIGDIYKVKENSMPPVQFTEFSRIMIGKDEIAKGDGNEKIKDYLYDLSIYLNGTCEENCNFCSYAYKQFKCCTKNSQKDIEIESFKDIIAQLSMNSTQEINILGGNIFKYTKLKEAISIIQQYNKTAVLHVYYKHILKCSPDIISELNKQVIFKIMVPALSFKKVFYLIKEKLDFNFVNITWEIIIDKESDINCIEKLDSLNINYNISPLYNYKNISFFEEYIFFNPSELFSPPILTKDILRNKTLNSNEFGKLIIMNNGDIHSNLLTKSLGNIKKHPLSEVIYKELTAKESTWLMIRDQYPCSDCIYQYLCPPLSNYEKIIGKPNICITNDDKIPANDITVLMNENNI